MEAEGLDTQRTLLWQELAQDAFDLVLHDLGSMTTREETLPAPLSLVGADGILVLDDLHFPRYRAHVEHTLAACGARYESAEEATRDLVGRFSWVAFPA